MLIFEVTYQWRWLSYSILVVGKHSFHRKSLHAIGSSPNPYEQAISIIGRTLSPFDEDNLIPCFGFGDGQFLFVQFLLLLFWGVGINYLDNNLMDHFFILATTHDQHVFSFYPDHRPCNGFEEALARYREIVPLLNLSGYHSL